VKFPPGVLNKQSDEEKRNQECEMGGKNLDNFFFFRLLPNLLFALKEDMRASRIPLPADRLGLPLLLRLSPIENHNHMVKTKLS